MTLQQWLVNGWLRAHRSSPEEIRDLLAAADRDLANSDVPGLSTDWQLAIAYNSARLAATAALAASGYRVERESSHYYVIQSLELTIGTAPETIAQFDAFRKKRNLAGYDRAGTVSEKEAAEMRTMAIRLRQAVEEWLGKNYPGLVSQLRGK